MPNQQPTYREQVDAQRIIQIREILKGLPQACGDFIRSIAVTTGTFTRLAYAIDLRTFFTFLQRERVAFADTPLTHLTDQQIGSVTQSDLTAYIEYLTYYFKEQDADEETAPLKPLVNHELAIKRKLSAIRSFYEFLFKNQRISANVTTLVSLPKIHESRLSGFRQEEMVRMLEQSATGAGLSERQKTYQKLTAKRDFALISLFLGTGHTRFGVRRTEYFRCGFGKQCFSGDTKRRQSGRVVFSAGSRDGTGRLSGCSPGNRGIARS